MSLSTLQLNRRDLTAMVLIVAGYAVALLLMPISHNFAILDDWAYVRPVEAIVNGEGFRPSEHAQATMFTHAYWGALFARLFGASFTTLTAANMTMSLIAALAFYVLLRQIGFEAGLSGLGVAILALNPYFLNLSYTFMTEITFLATLLITCLFYYLGLNGKGEGWLWLGGLFASLCFLTRQFGLVLPVTALIWLAYSRKLEWRKLAAVALLPAIAAIGYFAWSRGFGPTFSGSVGREELLDLVRGPSAWVRRASHFVYIASFLPGITVPLFGRVRNWKLTIILALAMAAAVYGLWQVKSNLVEAGQSTVNELSYSWLQPLVPNPTIIYCLGAALTVWLMAGIIERSWPGLMGLIKKQRTPSANDFLYLVAILLFGGTYIVSAGFLDRYWLPVLPFIIAGGLAVLKDQPALRLVPVIGVLAVVAIFGAAVHLDSYDLMGAQWEAGRWLVSQGVPYDKMEIGYSWDGYYLADEAIKRLGKHDINDLGRVFLPQQIIDPQYTISTENQPGYSVLKTYPYFSRLEGMTTHDLLVLKRE